MKLSKLKPDLTKAEEGIWIDVGDGLRIKVASLTNKKYIKMLRAKMKPYRTQVRSGRIKDEVVEGIVRECMARTVLLDWEGLTEDDEETVIPYSTDKAKELLDAYPEFMQIVHDTACDHALFVADEDDESSEN